LLYDSETWLLTKREENQLLEFERKKPENGVYRSKYNFELQREFDSPMIRRPEDLPQKAIFKARSQGTRWADGVNSDSRSLGASSKGPNCKLVVAPHK
jgi:hypothetical protein